MKVLLHYKREKGGWRGVMQPPSHQKFKQIDFIIYEKTLSLKFDDANVMKVFLCVNWQFCLSYFNLDAVSPIEEGRKT